MKFTHLHVHSHYSLLDGLGKIPELVNRAAELEMDSLALTDHGSLYGAIEFYQKAKKAGINPIIGCEMYVSANRMQDKRPGIDDKRYHLTVLAKDAIGYKNLIKLVTASHLEGFYYKPRIDKEVLREYSRGLIALSGCFVGEIPRAIQYKKPDRAEELIREYQEILGKENFYLELGAHLNYPDQKVINDGLKILSGKTGAKLVATNDIHYVRPEDSEAQDILVSVQTGNQVKDEDRLTMKGANLSMRSSEEMAEIFQDTPGAIENTREIASRCSIDIELGKNQLPYFPVPAGYDTNSYLKTLCYQGLDKRYGSTSSPQVGSTSSPQVGSTSSPQAGKSYESGIINRLEYELKVIGATGFASYFLIVHDFVNWSKKSGIVVGPGRGSAAGSLVSYLLGITNIDPIKYNLLFERFLNPERISMPDIDLDFADTRRDEVIEYVANQYGRDHVAQIITFGTMAARAAIRDTGRALGMPYSFCDSVAKLIPFNPTQGEKTGWLKKTLDGVQEFKELYGKDPEAKRLIDSAMKLEGVARHASTHACGVVIAPRPLEDYVPLQYAIKHGEQGKELGENKVLVTQYEMHAIEDLGLLKMDFLGLRNLTIIENTIKLIRKLNNINIDPDAIPLDDKETFKLFQRGDTTGLFQFESNGMKRYLKELRPNELEDLIAMVSLYRPGPIELIPSYIRRKHGKEKIEYLHPKLEPVLKNTYGIGVYQEQMMQIARDLAGYTLPEADTLRKAIGKKIKTLLAEQREKLTSGMMKNGIDMKTAELIWELFPPFARYGFNRSHAACYALIAYQTGYLKAHYPTEFMTALLAAESTDVEKISFFVDEARQMGIEILPPNVNESFGNFTVVGDRKVRFGLGAVKNVGSNIVTAIIAARKSEPPARSEARSEEWRLDGREDRKSGGKFSSLTDFAERIQHKDFNKKSIEALAKCGALDEFGERNLIISNLDLILEYNRESQKQKNRGQESLFGMTPQVSSASLRLREVEPAAKKEQLSWEKELLGLYITEHPIQEYMEKLKTNRALPIKNITADLRNQIVAIGGIVNAVQKIITKSGEPMLFVKLEDATARIEVLVFPKMLAKNPGIWQMEKALLVRGRISDKDGVPKILCEDAIEIA